MYTFDDIRNNGLLLFECKRGSHAFGLATDKSDIDTGGVYIAEPDVLFGIRNLENTRTNYQPQISSEKNDDVWYELGTFMELLSKSNPTALELLFVPEDCILYEHPIFRELRMMRDFFISKDTVKVLYKYAMSQIRKARGLNKKIVNPITERKTPLDFTYTFLNQGSQPILNWLNKYGLKPEYCGLNKIPHMNDMYGLYYDWGHHLANEPQDKNKLEKIRAKLDPTRVERIGNIENEVIMHYRGLTTEEIAHTTQLRLSSIDDKYDKPLCHISYNVDGFSDHCKKYKEYQEWVKKRNPARYESNLDKNFDSKNMMHCFRLIHMGKEIAQGKSMIIERTWDRDFLMDIRNHKYEYDYLISLLDKEKEEMDELMKQSNLPDEVDKTKLNELLFKLRMEQIKEQI